MAQKDEWPSIVESAHIILESAPHVCRGEFRPKLPLRVAHGKHLGCHLAVIGSEEIKVIRRINGFIVHLVLLGGIPHLRLADIRIGRHTSPVRERFGIDSGIDVEYIYRFSFVLCRGFKPILFDRISGSHRGSSNNKRKDSPYS